MSAKSVKKVETTSATSGLANIANQIAQQVTANVSAGTMARRPAVLIENGTVQVATKQGLQTVTITGACANVTSLPATNPVLRGTVGAVKNGQAMLTVGNGKSPRSGHNVIMWQVVTEALPCTASQAAEKVGSGGAAFIAYALKNGWLTSK